MPHPGFSNIPLGSDTGSPLQYGLQSRSNRQNSTSSNTSIDNNYPQPIHQGHRRKSVGNVFTSLMNTVRTSYSQNNMASSGIITAATYNASNTNGNIANSSSQTSLSSSANNSPSLSSTPANHLQQQPTLQQVNSSRHMLPASRKSSISGSQQTQPPKATLDPSRARSSSSLDSNIHSNRNNGSISSNSHFLTNQQNLQSFPDPFSNDHIPTNSQMNRTGSQGVLRSSNPFATTTSTNTNYLTPNPLNGIHPSTTSNSDNSNTSRSEERKQTIVASDDSNNPDFIITEEGTSNENNDNINSADIQTPRLSISYGSSTNLMANSASNNITEAATPVPDDEILLENSSTTNTDGISQGNSTSATHGTSERGTTHPLLVNGNSTSGEDDSEELYTIRLTPFIDHSSTSPFIYFGPVIRKIKPGTSIPIGRYTEKSKSLSNPTQNANAAVVFKSKVVSRNHAELIVTKTGSWFIKDVKSSSGTFLNHIRLSAANMESPEYPLSDSDILQLGMDYRGGAEEIYRCVKVKVEINNSWCRRAAKFNKEAHERLKRLNLVTGNEEVSPCAICLSSIKPCQSVFVSSCSHSWHYKCIRPIIVKTYPQFLCPNCKAVCDMEEDLDDDTEEEEEDESDQNKVNSSNEMINTGSPRDQSRKVSSSSTDNANGTTPSNGNTQAIIPEFGDLTLNHVKFNSGDGSTS
ncbi:hypothetical protein BVG19_g4382 [[Candida] boidinii]|nr:hypothetical protein BVG19_g4382 [[Candida] boidinii]OWB51931.1 hypothetical protein B5S27_g3502 [[Candida] boidinii]